MMSARSLRPRFICLGTVLAIALTGPALAAQRTVLGEFITSDICLSCQEAAPYATAVVEAHPEFAFVGINFGDDYQTAWGFDRAINFYGPMGFGTPFFVFDGLTAPSDFNLYEAEYLSRRAVATDVTVGVSIAPAAGSATFDITAHVCVEVGGQGKTMRILMVEALDNYPEAAHFTRYGFRQATATEDITLSAGECADVVQTLTFDATSWARPEDIRIIAWAQEPLSAGPAEVYQAGYLDGPFDGIFSDGFESGGTSAWN